jgi:phosphonoacetate hydrolase
MNADGPITPKTIFRRAEEWGIAGVLLTSKRKTAELFASGTLLSVAAEAPPPEAVRRHGPPPYIYSAEINEWLWAAAVEILEHRSEVGLLFVHTTDYPMHRWGEKEPSFVRHAAQLDRLLERLTAFCSGCEALLDNSAKNA